MPPRKRSVPALSPRFSPLELYGLTVTEGVLAAMASYVGDNERLPLVERVSRVEQWLAVLENNFFVP